MIAFCLPISLHPLPVFVGPQAAQARVDALQGTAFPSFSFSFFALAPFLNLSSFFFCVFSFSFSFWVLPSDYRPSGVRPHAPLPGRLSFFPLLVFVMGQAFFSRLAPSTSHDGSPMQGRPQYGARFTAQKAGEHAAWRHTKRRQGRASNKMGKGQSANVLSPDGRVTLGAVLRQ